jgi:HD-GYP domain-containing protein (c-di-GMP phosphodiesterase class II)
MERPTDLKGYMRVEIANLVANSVIGFNIYLHRNDRLLLYKPAQEMIAEEHIERMLKMGAEYLYVQEGARADLLDYYETNLDALLKAEAIKRPQKGRLLHQVTQHIVEKSFRRPDLQENYPKWEKAVKDNFNFIIDNQDIFDSMVVIAEKDSYTHAHSVNSSLLMMGFAIDSGVHDERVIRDIGIGGLLHDLGKAEIPASIIKKPGALSLSEWVMMKKHPDLGYALAVKHPSISDQARIVIQQHHEALNGTGYPDRLKNEQIDYWGRVGKVVDVYDALTSNRPYGFASAPYEALRKMIAMDSFDRNVLKNFINFLNIDHMNALRDRFRLLQVNP